MTPVALNLLPPGSSIQGTDVHLASGVVTDVDFTGHSVYVDGGASVLLKGGRLANPGSAAPLLNIGTAASKQTTDAVICSGVEIDGAGIQTTFEGAVKSWGSLVLKDCNLHGAPRDFVSACGPFFGAVDCWVGTPGVGAPAVAHVEAFHIFEGTFHILRTRFDVRQGVVTGGWTSPLFIQAFVGPVAGIVEDCDILGTAQSGAFYAVQLKPGTNMSCSAMFKNNRMDPGKSGYIAPNGATCIDLGGNLGAFSQPIAF